jgi:hypothetical protein
LKSYIIDVDLIIKKTDFNSAINSLIRRNINVKLKKAAANQAIYLLADNVLLDVKFQLGFFARKSFSIDTQIPFCKNIIVNKNILFPKTKDEILFTYWTFHNFLDKNHFIESTSFDIYRERYSGNWETLLNSDFFQDFINKLVASHKIEEVNKSIELFFKNKFKVTEHLNYYLKDLVLQNHSKLKVKLFYNKLKYRILKFIFNFNEYKDVDSLIFNRNVNSFPKNQKIHLIYSSSKLVRSELFKNIYTQISPKNSIFFRLLKSYPIVLVRSLFKVKQDIPKPFENFIGIVKYGRPILFELKNNIPTAVWRKQADEWVKSDFLGYQLISEYTIKEFELKNALINEILKKHWNLINDDNSKIHGDLTHFNVLINYDGKYSFIDYKSNNHSKLFDFFYFYAYLTQCVSKSEVLKQSEILFIIGNLKTIIKDVCKYKSKDEFESDFLSMNIPVVNGLKNIHLLKDNFKSIFQY